MSIIERIQSEMLNDTESPAKESRRLRAPLQASR